MATIYGTEFDRIARTWREIENVHDGIHPDRGQCGGVGACTMMAAGHDLEVRLIDALHEWRERKPVYVYTSPEEP